MKKTSKACWFWRVLNHCLLFSGMNSAFHVLLVSAQPQRRALIIFPGNQTVTKVETGVETDRVYLLQFKDSPDRRFFFWSFLFQASLATV